MFWIETSGVCAAVYNMDRKYCERTVVPLTEPVCHLLIGSNRVDTVSSVLNILWHLIHSKGLYGGEVGLLFLFYR